ncbi:MAG: alpha/beta hydrolase [Myxococcales bacterium]|nr:alpha/beta hydrolase [Myxococcales bacterium]
MSGARRLKHGRITLALHTLREGEGRALLLLHGLGERSPGAVPAPFDNWSGPIYALDFTGHGESSVSRGGGFTCEMLMADADTALRELGEATVVGRGLGAYVALLLAGARAGQVRGAILCDGIGLAGGGSRPGSPQVVHVPETGPAVPDPFAIAELTRDARPPDYAAAYVHQALEFSGLESPVCVCCVERPEWLDAVAKEPGVRETSLAAAIQLYSGVPG